MSFGRLTAAGLLVALVVAVSPSAARVPTRHAAVVVKGDGFSLSAIDKHKSLCFRLRAGAQVGSACQQVAHTKPHLAFVSVVTNGVTFIGGIAKRNVATVVVTFANGDKVTARAVRGGRYQGRMHGKVRFWAASHTGTDRLMSVAAMDKGGNQVESVTEPQEVPPPPEPPVPPPCRCGPPPANASIVCPQPAMIYPPPCE